ncbi:hypothetical protein M409DRAFT_66381 [Zasmidium cellare ATCC 36951]|uniref:SWR1-complex protein 4 n=1 Tax=Zasmidium cellare ATCC 36951 TaxID=1080233 RepID=A0A6A6CLJ7_ZASCE|nr:uncharacterized protein M409DRAFT_66381 [Zasmidium cellare ATCC 36951]KAF2166812.1 hypothetical protein M409DRAFT_66381 [Zasmidium cellare ATCC 36951]
MAPPPPPPPPPPTRPRRAAKWRRTPHPSNSSFTYAVAPSVPQYDHDTFEKNLAHAGWTEQETDYLINTYSECNGKWPVVADRYDYPDSDRSMEDLKTRFYAVQATLLQLSTPITSMTASEYHRYETLTNFNAAQETSRKKLAEGHLYRRANEVDEETVLLGELQRIMLNQATLDSQREELRHRLDNPSPSTNGYSYNTSQALTGLWQQLLTQDRMKKNPRLRPTSNQAVDGMSTMTPTSAAPRETPRRPHSLASATTLPVDLPKADQMRYGVVLQERLPTGVTFTSDKLTKPRIAKSSIQTEKIAAILQHIGVPEVIPLPTPAVIEQFESIMQVVMTILDLRKLGEKEEHELRVLAAGQ